MPCNFQNFYDAFNELRRILKLLCVLLLYVSQNSHVKETFGLTEQKLKLLKWLFSVIEQGAS